MHHLQMVSLRQHVLLRIQRQVLSDLARRQHVQAAQLPITHLVMFMVQFQLQRQINQFHLVRHQQRPMVQHRSLL